MILFVRNDVVVGAEESGGRWTIEREPGKKRGYCGHPEIELALMKLYRLTGDKRRLDLAAYFINERGQHPPHYFDIEKAEREAEGLVEQRYSYPSYEYSQSHEPVRAQSVAKAPA